MKSIGLAVIAIALMSVTGMWRTDFTKAMSKAKQDNKYVLLNFSGSDWCAPCIRTKKEIFTKEPFTSFADSNLVLVNADFPRLSKNRLSAEQVKENESLAEKFNKKGLFPLTILLDPDGKIIKEWEGYPGMSAQNFTDQIKTLEHCKQ